jgi:hypothetical protein
MKQLKAYYLFRRTPLPVAVTGEINDAILDLKKQQKQEHYLKAAYEFITTHYASGRIDTVLKLFDLYSTGLENLWSRNGFMHCTNQNYLLSILLVKSGYFNESDIKLKWTLIGFYSPHQYLKVRVNNNRWVEVDCWARHYGIGYGDHAHGFNTTIRRSFVK